MPEAADIQAIVASLSSNPFATIVTDNRKPDNPIVAANDAFFDLTGYCAEEVIGRNCRFLAGIGSEPEAQAALRVAIAEGTPAVVELWNYRKDGSPFRNALMIAPILDNFGNAVFFVGSQLEVRNQSLQNIRPLQSRRRVLALTSKQRRVLLLMTQGHRDRHATFSDAEIQTCLTLYDRRSRVEAKMRCLKLLGERLMARTFDRHTTELHIRAALLNRFIRLGTPKTTRVA